MAYFDHPARRKFSFVSDHDAGISFAVVQFKSRQALSELYEFEIMLVSDDTKLESPQHMEGIIRSTAAFTIHFQEGESDSEIKYHGMLAEFKQLHEFTEGATTYYCFLARLVPNLYQLTLKQDNRLFRDKTVPQVIDSMLSDCDHEYSPSSFTAKPGYAVPENAEPWKSLQYVCQYNESDFNFLNRWLEREGIYYYFRDDDGGGKVILANDKDDHGSLPGGGGTLTCGSVGSAFFSANMVYNFTCRRRPVPDKVILKDHNYEIANGPNIDAEYHDPATRQASYPVCLYGENLRFFGDVHEGPRLARIRYEELQCRKVEYLGESKIPYLRPGYTFILTGDRREAFNQEYLITEVSQEGSQAGYLLSGIQEGLGMLDLTPVYRNSFTCIPATAQYRAPRKTPKPKISGALHARVVGAPDQAVQLDNDGRYTMQLPFDELAQSSHPVRMVQPYATHQGHTGSYGVHFPLHDETEVQLTFVDGDPDRPVISGAVYHQNAPDAVTSANPHQCVFRDHAGNELLFDATPGSEYVRLYSPCNNSKMELGEDGITKETWKDNFEYGKGFKGSAFTGATAEFNLSLAHQMTLGLAFDLFVGGKFSWADGLEYEYNRASKVVENETDLFTGSEDDHILTAGDGMNVVGGTHEKRNSILLADKDAMNLSYGLADASDFLPIAKSDKNKLKYISLATSVVSAMTLFGIQASNNEKATISSSIVIPIVLMAVLGGVFRKHFKADRINPLEHAHPESSLTMNEAINLAVNEILYDQEQSNFQWGRFDDNQKERSKITLDRNKIILKTLAVHNRAKKVKALINLNSGDGNIGQIDLVAKALQGANPIDRAKILLKNDGVLITTVDDHNAEKAKISIRKDGTINIIGKKAIILQNDDAGGELIFKPGNKAAFKVDDKKFKVLENFDAKNLKVEN